MCIREGLITSSPVVAAAVIEAPATSVALAVADTPVLPLMALMAAAREMALLSLALNEAVSVLVSEAPTNWPLMEKSPAAILVVVPAPSTAVAATPEAEATWAS